MFIIKKHKLLITSNWILRNNNFTIYSQFPPRMRHNYKPPLCIMLDYTGHVSSYTDTVSKAEPYFHVPSNNSKLHDINRDSNVTSNNHMWSFMPPENPQEKQKCFTSFSVTTLNFRNTRLKTFMLSHFSNSHRCQVDISK